MLGSQVSGRPVSREPVRPSYRQVFWLLDQSTPGAFPGPASTPVAFSRFRPQLQRRDHGFAPSSLFPYGTCKFFHFMPVGPGCQGESLGSSWARKHKGIHVHPQGLGHGGAFGLRRNQKRGRRGPGDHEKKAPGARGSLGPAEVDWRLGKIEKRPGGHFWIKQI